jgi:DNA-binding MarR family transcriptional regulator
VTALVDRLIKRKLVRRVSHETDRRVVLVEMTKTGNAASWAQIQYVVRGASAASAALTGQDAKRSNVSSIARLDHRHRSTTAGANPIAVKRDQISCSNPVTIG